MIVASSLAVLLLQAADQPVARAPQACDRSLTLPVPIADEARQFRVILESTGEDCQTAMATIRVVDQTGRIWVSDGFPLEGPTPYRIETLEQADEVLRSGITNGILVSGSSLPARLPPAEMYEEHFIWNIQYPSVYDQARDEDWPFLCWSHHYEQSHCAAFDLNAGFAFVLFSSGI